MLEPLLLWVALTDRAGQFEALLGSESPMRAELENLMRLRDAGSLETALATGDPTLRPEYAKVWRSYVVRRDAPARDMALRLELRTRVLELEAQKRVTRYRMAKDLGLNPGNLHAFLAQANPSKLSLDRVAELVRYLEAA